MERANKENKKLVSVVVVTYNRKEVAADCLASILKMDCPNFEVILVDNGSEDGTVEAIQERFPDVKVVASETNSGLNGGKNLGEAQARGDYILFLDSDTLVDKNLLTELVKVAENDSQVGMVCPKMYYHQPEDVIWYAGSFVNLWTSQTKNIGVNEKDQGQHDQIRETEFAPTAYLVRREVIEKLKGHDEFLFMTYGDTDYGFRTREAGFKVMFCPTAKLWHRIKAQDNVKTIRALGYNLPMRAYYFARNRMIFMKRHAPKFNFAVFTLVFFPLITLYITYKIIDFGGGLDFLKPHWQGSFDGLRYLFDGRVENNW